MPSKRIPPYKVRTPKNFPELQQQWETIYKEYREQGIRKSSALEMIGKENGVARQTVMYHLFPRYKNSHNKWDFRQSEKSKRRKNYKKKYNWIKRHIDEYIEQAYQCSPINGDMTIKQLSDKIFAISGVSFHPDTLIKLVKNYELDKSERLLIPSQANKPLYYRLEMKH